jgi:uncharacterized membrane protein YbhN (UPF0104 family)
MVKPSIPNTRWRLGYRRGLVVIAVLGVGLYLILPQITDLDDASGAIRHADRGWLLVAGLCLLTTYAISALIYLSLAKKRLRYPHTVLLQVASMFAGRLLPAGVGAVGLNFLYLRRNRHTPAEAGAVVATNNTLGFFGNVLLVVFLFLATDTTIPSWHVPDVGLWLGIGVVALIGFGLFVRKTGPARRALKGLRLLARDVAAYRRQPLKLVFALLCSVGLTAVYALLLYACVRAIGGSLSFPAAVIVMSVGVAGATVTPTPGGLGGAEAALAGALVLYDIDASAAIAIALLYRLFTYWLGLGLGGVALLIAECKKYI